MHCKPRWPRCASPAVSEARLACDVGSVRIGVAVCDRDGILVSPRPAVPAGLDAPATIAELAAEIDAVEIVVGLPLQLDGAEGTAALGVRQWCDLLATKTGIPIVLFDERLTTTQAQRQFHDAGRNTRQSRPHIDSAAAVILLQSYLDTRRSA